MVSPLPWFFCFYHRTESIYLRVSVAERSKVPNWDWPFLQFFNSGLQKNQQCTLSQVNGNLHWPLIDWQLLSRLRSWFFYTKVLDFTIIHFTIIVPYSHLNYPWFNFGNGIFWCNYFVLFLIIKSGFCSCDLSTENKRHCIPTFWCIHLLSGVSPLFTPEYTC